MPFYEHVYLARQDLAPAQVESLTEAFTKVVTDMGGEVKGTEYWGLRTIAYRIAKNRKAHYVLLNIEAPAPAIQELERQVSLNEDVIRYQTIRVDALETGPSAMMKKSDRAERGERGERGDRGDRGDRGPRGDRGDRGPRPDRAPRVEEGAW
ncbi:30S ribosomal protein S6 [Sandaracinobacter neustonicus]|uniref:Small ribosomal subunit protein bS6 n=1 Tax=Sandaracinobacter neustonicus TaxID=1715348 RepID=A0A501XFA5_9SPHN|nr:30S ribosomal protein S6 [Sandaracinobacter neustonicus]TPE59210.1 30S ribosomal protein S6 [Sandaracinobacter neustonicus]